MRGRRIGVNAPFDVGTKMPNQSLDWPRRRVTKGANRVPFDLVRDLEQLPNLPLLGAPLSHPGQHPPHPARPFATGCALPTTFVLIEVRNARDSAYDVRRFVHNDDGGRPEPTLEVP